MTITTESTSTPTYLSTTEASKILRVQERVIGSYIASKGLKAARVGKRWLIARHDLDAFVRSRMA